MGILCASNAEHLPSARSRLFARSISLEELDWVSHSRGCLRSNASRLELGKGPLSLVVVLPSIPMHCMRNARSMKAGTAAAGRVSALARR